MDAFDLFSRRNKTFQFDVLEYDSLPTKFRNQVYYIWKYALGIEYAKNYTGSRVSRVFEILHDAICREHGLSYLAGRNNTPAKECQEYLRSSSEIEIVLDLIELSIRMIDPLQEGLSHNDKVAYGISLKSNDAINDLNKRFIENGIGYEFSNGILIRKDSEILHEETIKPALYLLQEQDFEGALEEFLIAHDHFRRGNHKESIINAAKAFESTMKTICAKRNWEVSGNGNAAKLIKAIVENGLIPDYLQTHVNSLKTTFEGLSTVRNNTAGHGQGENTIAVPDHFVNYALHLCGTNIVFLIKAYKALPDKE